MYQKEMCVYRLYLNSFSAVCYFFLSVFKLFRMLQSIHVYEWTRFVLTVTEEMYLGGFVLFEFPSMTRDIRN